MKVSVLLRRASLATSIIAALCASSSFAAGSAETYGHDAVSAGKGQSSVASDSGTAAAFVNPAALSRLTGPALSGGVQLAAPQLTIDTEREFSNDDPLRPALPSPIAGFSVGFGVPLNLIVKDRVALGVSAYLPSTVLVRARAYDPARPFFTAYDSTTEHYELFAGASVRIVDGVALGVGARLGAGQGGGATIALDPIRNRFTRQEIDTGQASVASPIGSLLIGPFGIDEIKGRVGFVVRDKSSFDVTLPASLTIEGLDIGLLIDLVTISNFSPRTWTGGAQVDIFERFHVSTDIQYAQWSEAPAPFLRVQNNISGEGLERLGLGGALDAPGPDQDRVVSPGFVDTINVRAGAEGEVVDGLIVRAGYGWRPTPVPNQTSGTNIVDNSTHTLSAGLGVRADLPLVADKPFWFNLAYQAAILLPRTAEKTSSRDPVGSWTSSGVMHHLMLDVRYFW
ncbi:MAG TPA: hypothetical protein VGF99_17375 [Myxococcota bacterium]